MGIALLHGDIADYDWGGRGGISDLLGWPTTEQRQAEWWLGTHPLRPTRTESGELLSDWLAREQGESELPYLFKVLAPVKPLSLQVHPSPAQAEEGFAREEALGLALDDPHRMFKDRHAKPELVIALAGPFEALAGLRPATETLESLRALTGDTPPAGIAQWMEQLETRSLAQVVSWLLRQEGLAAHVPGELAAYESADDTLARLHRHYPKDPGIAVGLMMNRLTLQPGEAAFLDAGVLHAYLEGFAIELMAPSDNVLRGGLTPKHVDVDRLLDIAVFSEQPPPRLQSVETKGGGRRYQPPHQPWGVGALEGSKVEALHELHGPTLVVCTTGAWTIEGQHSSVTLESGQAAVVSSGEQTLRLAGSGALWWAGAE